MTKKQSDSIALFLSAMQEYSNSKQERQELFPVIPPRMFAAVCKNLSIDSESTRLLATFAVSLVLGMVKEPENVSAIVGGDEGSGLIVQVEDLGSLLLDSIRKAADNDGSLIETKVGVVNLESGETISEKTVLLNVKE